MEVIGFRLSGRYALFTKPFTRNQPQSFVIPPKTAISGMIGGILGFGREEYQQKLAPFKYSVILVKEPTKYTARFSLLQGKDAKFSWSENPIRTPPKRGSRSPTTFELLKNPVWDIFISAPSEILEELEWRIERHLYHYVPYLGVANAFARLELFQPRIELEKVKRDGEIPPLASFFETGKVRIKVNRPLRFYNEVIPIEFQEGRKLPKTREMTIATEPVEVLNLEEIADDLYRYRTGERDYTIRFI